MSYLEISPSFYTTLQPDSPYHPGAPGWASAPWPGWGMNPNNTLPQRMAVGNVEVCSSCQAAAGTPDGIGAYYAPKHPLGEVSASAKTTLLMFGIVGLLLAFGGGIRELGKRTSF